MRRTQIYLSDRQHDLIGRRAKASGRTRSQYIRDAVDDALKAPEAVPAWKSALMSAAGLWADNPEAVNKARAARESLDRDPFGKSE
jgi:hypothetical protein